MGKKKSEIVGEKLLRKQIDTAYAVKGSTEDPWSIPYGGGTNWHFYTTPNDMPWMIWRGYFDVSGWNNEQLTAFIQGGAFQRAGRFTAGNNGPLPILEVYSMLTKAVIPDAAFDSPFAGAPLGYSYCPPGMMNSNYNLEEIFLGMYELYTSDSNITPSLRLTTKDVWGCGDATAGDKIHITIGVALHGQDPAAGNVVIPAQTVIVPAVVVDEKDLVYMERLRRSYVLGESRNP